MVHPKSGTEECRIATEKFRKTMEEKYGSKEGARKFFCEIGAKGGRNGHTGGFASNPELARRAGAKGGRISRRTGIKNHEGKKWKEDQKSDGGE